MSGGKNSDMGDFEPFYNILTVLIFDITFKICASGI